MTSFFTNQNYTQRIVPKIQSMSENVGGTLGQEIKVTGTGFSQNLQNYDCKVAGEQCRVVSVSDRGLTIRVPAKDAGNLDFGKLPQDGSDTSEQQKPYIGGGGALYERYTRVRGSAQEELDDIKLNQRVPVERRVITELSSP